MPVTDTSKKVRNVINAGGRRTGSGSAPPPTATSSTSSKEFEVVPTEADIVRTHLSPLQRRRLGLQENRQLPHRRRASPPRACRSETAQGGRRGGVPTGRSRTRWAIVTVQGILDNDFYIGTLRQGKYTRAKDQRQGRHAGTTDEQIVIENHHQAIIDYRTFATTRALREKRSTLQLPGSQEVRQRLLRLPRVRRLRQPDVLHEPRRPDQPPTPAAPTTAGALAGCTSHHIRADKLDELLKIYVRQRDGSLGGHAGAAQRRPCPGAGGRRRDRADRADHLAEVLHDLQEELKATKRQRIRDIMKHPDQEDTPGARPTTRWRATCKGGSRGIDPPDRAAVRQAQHHPPGQPRRQNRPRRLCRHPCRRKSSTGATCGLHHRAASGSTRTTSKSGCRPDIDTLDPRRPAREHGKF